MESEKWTVNVDYRLTPKQNKALALLIEGNHPTDVARMVNVTTQTIYNWRVKHPNFRKKLEDASNARVEAAKFRIERAGLSAVNTLEQICTDEGADPAHRVQAASKLLSTFVDTSGLKKQSVQISSADASNAERGLSSALAEAESLLSRLPVLPDPLELPGPVEGEEDSVEAEELDEDGEE